MFRVLFIAVVVALCCWFAFSGKTKNKVIFTPHAPKPIGPYSQAILSGGTLFVSGQIGLNNEGLLDTSNIENECSQALNNIQKIVEAAGMKLSQVRKSTIYCTDLKNFSKINAVYSSYFSEDPPARETVEVKALPKGAHVEISVIAN